MVQTSTDALREEAAQLQPVGAPQWPRGDARPPVATRAASLDPDSNEELCCVNVVVVLSNAPRLTPEVMLHIHQYLHALDSDGMIKYRNVMKTQRSIPELVARQEAAVATENAETHPTSRPSRLLSCCFCSCCHESWWDIIYLVPAGACWVV